MSEEEIACIKSQGEFFFAQQTIIAFLEIFLVLIGTYALQSGGHLTCINSQYWGYNGFGYVFMYMHVFLMLGTAYTLWGIFYTIPFSHGFIKKHADEKDEPK